MTTTHFVAIFLMQLQVICHPDADLGVDTYKSASLDNQGEERVSFYALTALSMAFDPVAHRHLMVANWFVIRCR